MKITPLELRQFEFEKTFRGYSIEEVDMFINNLAQEWERVLTETKMMRMQLELAEKEATKLREIEMTLFKTLKTAEDTSTMITEQANQQAARNISEATLKADKQLSDAAILAEKQLTEARIESEKTLSEARIKANDIIKKAQEKAYYIKEEILSDVKAVEKDFESLKHYKTNLLVQMRNLATATEEHVNRFEDKFDIDAIESKIKKANAVISELDTEIIKPEEIDEAKGSVNLITSEIVENVVDTSGEVIENVVDEVVENNEKVIEETSKIVDNATDDIVETSKDVNQEASEIAENVVSEIIETGGGIIEETSEVVENVVEKSEEVIHETTPKVVENVIDEITETSQEVTKETSSAVQSKVALIASSVNKLATSDSDEEIIERAPNETIETKNDRPKDDLTKIEGIGSGILEVLNNRGIKSFRDLATTPLYRIKEYLSAEGSQFNFVDPSTWTEQALLAAEGRWDELASRQEELKGGKEVGSFAEIEKVVETTVKPVNNLDNITEEMLEKVNKVKSAIRKAMIEKSDKHEIEKDSGSLPTIDDVLKKSRNKSGSFFDNID